MPPSDEGGGFCEAKDGGREQCNLYKTMVLRKIILSFSRYATASSSEEALSVNLF